MNVTQASVRKYVETLDLPQLTRAAPTAPAAPVTFSGSKEVVAVGSQLAEFSDSVPASLRPLISNSMLLAQLAANKATVQSADVFDFHLKYRDVLSNIGWQIGDKEDEVKEIKDKNLSVHKAIIPVLTAMLGPAVAATSLVVSVLNGLQQMDADSPWITLFDRQSQHAHGAKFQISYVDLKESEPVINLLSCAIRAEREITQVLFFKFSSQRAELHKSSSALLTTAGRLEADKQVIESRVQAFIAEFVKKIEI